MQVGPPARRRHHLRAPLAGRSPATKKARISPHLATRSTKEHVFFCSQRGYTAYSGCFFTLVLKLKPLNYRSPAHPGQQRARIRTHDICQHHEHSGQWCGFRRGCRSQLTLSLCAASLRDRLPTPSSPLVTSLSLTGGLPAPRWSVADRPSAPAPHSTAPQG